jgi:hypothetical protein
MATMLCSSSSRGSRTIPPTLCDSSDAKVTVVDQLDKRAFTVLR